MINSGTFVFGNGDFLIIEKYETLTIPCHVKIIAGGIKETDLIENIVRHLTPAALDRPAAEYEPGDGTQAGRQEC